MSNSSLVSVRVWSPNKSSRNGARIDKITVHHAAMVGSAAAIGNVFKPVSRKASATYGIGVGGEVGQYVDEAYRPWTSSSYANDRRAVTIEVANSSAGGDWPVSAASWNSLVNLCVDVCRRNGISRLNWTGTSSGNLTCHYMFAATACPGPYLKARMGQLASEVNAKLGSGAPVTGVTSDGKLVEDGIWGSATTLRLQQVTGAPYKDGVISRQNPQHKSRLKACTSGWEFVAPAGAVPGSQVISEVQKRCGVAADGFVGPDTINALIKRYQAKSGATLLDGKLDYPSVTVQTMQRELNAGRF